MTPRTIEFTLFEKVGDNTTGNPVGYAHVPYTGIFHAWSTEGDASDMTAVAIVERPDGSIVTPAAFRCKFVKPLVFAEPV